MRYSTSSMAKTQPKDTPAETCDSASGTRPREGSRRTKGKEEGSRKRAARNLPAGLDHALRRDKRRLVVGRAGPWPTGAAENGVQCRSQATPRHAHPTVTTTQAAWRTIAATARWRASMVAGSETGAQNGMHQRLHRRVPVGETWTDSRILAVRIVCSLRASRAMKFSVFPNIVLTRALSNSYVQTLEFFFVVAFVLKVS